MLVIHRSITIRETRRAANNSWRGLSERERDAKDGRAFDLNLFGDGRRMAQAGRDAITRGGGREPERELTRVVRHAPVNLLRRAVREHAREFDLRAFDAPAVGRKHAAFQEGD